MQKAHELLLTEAEIYGLSPLPQLYDARDNEMGCTCEILLYGTTGRYAPLAKRFRSNLEFLHKRAIAARTIERMLRGWIVRATITAYKAAVKVQNIYRRWKAAAKRRAIQRTGTSAEHQSLLDKYVNPAKNAAQSQQYERVSRILARGKAYGLKGAGGGNEFFYAVQDAVANKKAQEAAEKQARDLKRATPRQGSMGKVSAGTTAITDRINAAQNGENDGDGPVELGDDLDQYVESAVRIQARMRTRNAQKQVYARAEAAEANLDRMRNQQGMQAVNSVYKAYRARNAFSMLLLKAFKQRQMAIVMQGTEDGAAARAANGVSEQAWRMSVEAVRARCLQGLIPAEEELNTKVKAHIEYMSLQQQFERATARLQFWEALKNNQLPPHMLTYNMLNDSRVLERAHATVVQLMQQRALPLPNGVPAKLHVSKLVGAVKALQDLTNAMGCEMHEMVPLERQLRSHLAHMGIPDPSSQEAPQPVSSSSTVMMDTAASKHRTAAVLAAQQPIGSPSKKTREGASDGSSMMTDSPRIDTSIVPPAGQPPMNRAAARRRSVAMIEDAEKEANIQPLTKADVEEVDAETGEKKAPGEALEEAITSAMSELHKLEAVRELLYELKAADQPPKFVPKLAKEAESKREALADAIRRVSDLESQHEHLSHFCAQARGSLDLLEAADAFDYRRSRRRLRGEYAQLGIQSMQTLKGESYVRKLKDTGMKIDCMAHYIETVLPALEKNAREKIEALAIIHISLPTDILDEQLQEALVEDIEEESHMSDGEKKGFYAQRLRITTVKSAAAPPESSFVHLEVLEGKGKSVDELLALLSNEAVVLKLPLTATRKVIQTAPQHVARQAEEFLPELRFISVETRPARVDVHDSRTLAHRKKELVDALANAKAELRPLQAKELVASAAQAQLWKLEGVEEALAQCQNPRLLALKDKERAHKPRLHQLAKDSESSMKKYQDAQKIALELDAQVEALTRLMTAAAQDTTFSQIDKEKGKEYSVNASRDVAMNIQRERRLHIVAVREHEEDQATEEPVSSSKETAQRKYKWGARARSSCSRPCIRRTGRRRQPSRQRTRRRHG